MTLKEYDKQFKIKFQLCNAFATCSGTRGEMIRITSIHYGIYTLGLYPEELDLENF